ncbi:zinc finger protein chinmo-like [Tigriopus californicus]|nr:zinc finger protein chinmo-like [Tigriopus californicus]|eukprot:TCALIF_00222-PA protein Name:"Similar to lolal Longitudinals lacking protein-like (Drosophila melanogaster)" AED:0.22 eAED:0.22 QI:0/-1/0/1/-1/1/1/0/614
MGSSHESYVLRWNEFQSNMAQCFQEFRQDDEYLDVTLSCDEEAGGQIRAHRVILAASSAYFRRILAQNPAPHPILLMPPSVTLGQLANLIDFMYNGEVCVLQENIDAFMKLAEMMKVKGLVEEKARPQIPKLPPGLNVRRQPVASPASHTARAPPVLPSPAKRARPNPTRGSLAPRGRGGAGASGGRPSSSRAAPLPPPSSAASAVHAAPHLEPEPDFDDGYDDAPAYPPATAKNPAGPSGATDRAGASGTRLIALQCPKCPSRLPGVDAFKEHMEMYHVEGDEGAAGSGLADVASEPEPVDQEHACDICGKVLKTRKTLINHCKRMHGGFGEAKEPETPEPVPESEPADHFPELPLNENELLDSGSPEMTRPKGQAQKYNKPPAAPASGASSQDLLEPRPFGAGTPRGPQRPPQSRPHMLASPADLAHPSGSGAKGASRPHPSQADYSMRGARPDIRKIGMRLGGKISISSMESSSPRPTADRKQGLSITKLKGEGGPAGRQSPAATVLQPRPGPSRGLGSDMPPIVKQEPHEHYETANPNEHLYEDDYSHDSQPGGPSNLASSSNAPQHQYGPDTGHEVMRGDEANMYPYEDEEDYEGYDEESYNNLPEESH